MIGAAVFLLILLLFFPSVAISGSRYGASLWLTELLPTLLPFFIAIRLFQYALPRTADRRPFLLTGLLAGYPAGATLVTYQYRKRCLDKRTAYFYLGFVNNPSPMFVLVYCGKSVLGLSGIEPVLLFAILIFSSFAGSFLFRLFNHTSGAVSQTAARCYSVGSNQPEAVSASVVLDQIILDSFRVMMNIGGYVILFSILGQVIHSISPGKSIISCLFCGLMEISSGISFLKACSLSLYTKKVLTTVMLAFGGFSAAFQTNSILTSSELSIIPYLLNKALNSALAGLIAILLFRIF